MVLVYSSALLEAFAVELANWAEMTLLLHRLQPCKPGALIHRTPLLLRVIRWRLLAPCLARIVD